MENLPIIVSVAAVFFFLTIVSYLTERSSRHSGNSLFGENCRFRVHLFVLAMHPIGLFISGLFFYLAYLTWSRSDIWGLIVFGFVGLLFVGMTGISYWQCRTARLEISETTIKYRLGWKRMEIEAREIEKIDLISMYLFLFLKSGKRVQIPLIFAGNGKIVSRVRALYDAHPRVNSGDQPTHD